MKSMNKTIGASVIGAALLAGVAVPAHADTVTTTKTTTTTVVTTTVVKDDKVPSGEIKAGTTTTKTKPTATKPSTTVVEPYYNYNGYTARNADFELDKYFVTALNYGNFNLNNVKLTKKPIVEKKPVKSMVNDTTVYKTEGEVTSFSFPVKAGIIKKADFMKAHKENKIIGHKKGKASSKLTFQTKVGSYSANFNKAGTLTSIKVNPSTIQTTVPAAPVVK